MSRDRGKRQQFLSMKDLNVFLTDFCKNYQRHDYSTCLQWHSNMSPHLGTNEVKKKHLRRPPLKETGNYTILTYENDKCANPDSCPDGKTCNKCHHEKEFMYHPFVYMTAECKNGTNCPNRFCAFFHTEGERKMAEANRAELMKKLQRSSLNKSQSQNQNQNGIQAVVVQPPAVNSPAKSPKVNPSPTDTSPAAPPSITAPLPSQDHPLPPQDPPAPSPSFPPSSTSSLPEEKVRKNSSDKTVVGASGTNNSGNGNLNNEFNPLNENYSGSFTISPVVGSSDHLFSSFHQPSLQLKVQTDNTFTNPRSQSQKSPTSQNAFNTSPQSYHSPSSSPNSFTSSPSSSPASSLNPLNKYSPISNELNFLSSGNSESFSNNSLFGAFSPVNNGLSYLHSFPTSFSLNPSNNSPSNYPNNHSPPMNGNLGSVGSGGSHLLMNTINHNPISTSHSHILLNNLVNNPSPNSTNHVTSINHKIHPNPSILTNSPVLNASNNQRIPLNNEYQEEIETIDFLTDQIQIFRKTKLNKTRKTQFEGMYRSNSQEYPVIIHEIDYSYFLSNYSIPSHPQGELSPGISSLSPSHIQSSTKLIDKLTKIKHKNLINCQKIYHHLENNKIYFIFDYYSETLSSFSKSYPSSLLRSSSSLLGGTENGFHPSHPSLSHPPSSSPSSSSSNNPAAASSSPSMNSFSSGSLNNYLNSFNLTPLCKSFIYQLCNVIVFLSVNHNIVIHDLLPDNIFIEMRKDGNHQIVLGDIFSLSNKCKNQPNSISNEFQSKNWISPEERNENQSFFHHQKTTTTLNQSNMWKLGMLIFYLISGGEEANFQRSASDFGCEYLFSLPEWKSLIHLLLKEDENLRLTPSHLFHHPVFWFCLPNKVSKFVSDIFQSPLALASNGNGHSVASPASSASSFSLIDFCLNSSIFSSFSIFDFSVPFDRNWKNKYFPAEIFTNSLFSQSDNPSLLEILIVIRTLEDSFLLLTSSHQNSLLPPPPSTDLNGKKEEIGNKNILHDVKVTIPLSDSYHQIHITPSTAATILKYFQDNNTDLISYFQSCFPFLIFKVWEIIYLEKKQMELKCNCLDDLLSNNSIFNN